MNDTISTTVEPAIHILHVSDIHFGCPDPNEHQPRIAESVEKAVREFPGKIDFVVFTGDLSHSALPDQFQRGEDWLIKLSAITGAQIILVPGNHDINRAAASCSTLKEMRKSDKEFAETAKAPLKNFAHLSAFCEWFKQAKEDQEVFLNDWTDINSATVDLVSTTVRGMPIHFLCLNTAIVSFENGEKGKLCADVAGINRKLMQVDASKGLVVAVGHHPLSWLIKWNAAEVSKILLQETGAHIYLHGHMHKDSSKATYAGTGDGITVSEAGAAYPGAKWAKSFSILKFLPSKGQFQPIVFEHSEKSGQWDQQPARSKLIGMKFPSLLGGQGAAAQAAATREPVPLTEHVTGQKHVTAWTNPFSSIIANGIPAQAVHKLFVDKRDIVTGLSRPQDALIEGQRGTGKTMLLRYFSAEVQRSIANTKAAPDFISYLNSQNRPFGVYVSIAAAGFDRTDFLAVKSVQRRTQLFAARMSAYLSGTVFQTLYELSLVMSFAGIDTAKLCERAWRALTFNKGPAFEIDSPTNHFSEFRMRCNELVAQIDGHLGSLLPGGVPTSMNPTTTFKSYDDMLLVVQQGLAINTPFFMLLDDIDKLGRDEQMALFGVASARNHSLVCYKFGIISDGQKSFHSAPGIAYKVDDDYDLIRLNWVDHGSRGSEKAVRGTSYAEVVQEIFRLRIEMAKWPNRQLSEYFAVWEPGDKIRAQVRRTHELAYETRATSEKVRQPFQSIWDKQGEALYFRHVRQIKTTHRYAGPDDIVELSSGVFRQFLEICHSAVAKSMSRGWEPDSGDRIGPTIQNAAIREWSEKWMKKLVESGQTASAATNSSVATGLHIATLAQSLSRFFSERLYSDSKDPELFAIAIRGKLTAGSFCDQLLKLAVHESVLQPRDIDYTSKSEPGVRLLTFSLNRRLAPQVDMGTKMQGRYELSLADLELAAKDTGAFLKAKLAKLKASNQGKLPL
jgi:hypothetical protein